MATKKPTYLLSFCHHDTLLCLADGLFKSLNKGDRKTKKLDLTIVHGKETVRFTCIEPLGADDLRFLQGVVALAGLKGSPLSPTPTNSTPKILRAGLKTTDEEDKKNAVYVEIKITQLLKELGMRDGGPNIKSFKASIHRMSTVTVLYERAGFSASTHLLSFEMNLTSKILSVALNPRLAKAILGGKNRHTRIELDEVRAINKDTARIIHQRLCGFINQGKSHRLTMETLCSYVWADDKTTSVAMQRSRVKEALEELGSVSVGWTVKETTKGIYTITRPTMKSKRTVIP